MSGAESKLSELVAEFRSVVSGRGGTLDVILPPVVYGLLDLALGFTAAVVGALAVAAVILVMRLLRKRPLGYALGGAGAVAAAAGLAWVSGRAEGFYLSGLVSTTFTLLLALGSLALRTPLVALTSHLARGWPLGWYAHPRVRPAYREVTWAWAAVFALRLAVGLVLFRRSDPILLSAWSLLGGWPVTVALLVFTYLYGLWRLRRLAGPSVEEFESGAAPPWIGQERGF